MSIARNVLPHFHTVIQNTTFGQNSTTLTQPCIAIATRACSWACMMGCGLELGETCINFEGKLTGVLWGNLTVNWTTRNLVHSFTVST